MTDATRYIPLMRPGNSRLNKTMTVVYLVFFPITILLIPFYLGYAVGRNKHGWADRLADSPLGAIPPIGNGGWQAGLTIFIVVLVLFGVTGAALPTDTTDQGTAEIGTTPTSTPASTPTPTDDRDHTVTPTASATPTLTPTLTTLQSIRVVDDRYDEGRDQFSGTGQTVTDTFGHGGAAMVVIFEHDGDSNFIVELMNAETGEQEELVVNEIGETSGAVAFPAGGDDYRLDINADGDWHIEIVEPLPLEEDVEHLPAESSGNGIDVVGPVELNGNTVVTGSHDGDSNFIVRAVDELAVFDHEQELIFNEVGAFEGETIAQYDGVVWISVEADGEWTLEFE